MPTKAPTRENDRTCPDQEGVNRNRVNVEQVCGKIPADASHESKLPFKITSYMENVQQLGTHYTCTYESERQRDKMEITRGAKYEGWSEK